MYFLIHTRFIYFLGHGRQVMMSDRVNLPYCEAVMYEVLRLRPPATLAIPHKTLCDTSVGR